MAAAAPAGPAPAPRFARTVVNACVRRIRRSARPGPSRPVVIPCSVAARTAPASVAVVLQGTSAVPSTVFGPTAAAVVGLITARPTRLPAAPGTSRWVAPGRIAAARVGIPAARRTRAKAAAQRSSRCAALIPRGVNGAARPRASVTTPLVVVLPHPFVVRLAPVLLVPSLVFPAPGARRIARTCDRLNDLEIQARHGQERPLPMP